MGPYEGAWHILPGPKGPQCVGGREHRGTDIPISGAATDAAGDANGVPPLLLLLNQLPVCQVLGKGHIPGQEWEFPKKHKVPKEKQRSS